MCLSLTQSLARSLILFNGVCIAPLHLRPPAVAALLHASKPRVSVHVVVALVEHNSHSGPAALYLDKSVLGWAIEFGRNDIVARVSRHSNFAFFLKKYPCLFLRYNFAQRCYCGSGTKRCTL